MSDHPTRRSILAVGTVGAALHLAASGGAATGRPAAAAQPGRRFLWGAATAGHQVEGNNINSEAWVAEHVEPSMFADRSGDACDSYDRYAEDIALARSFGLNTYRFGIEWSRIEPERGEFSNAALDHYKRMIAACREAGLHPLVTYSHFTVPRWFAGAGGWEVAGNADHFVRFCDRATRHLGAEIGHALTFNEPNLGATLNWQPFFRNAAPAFAAANAAAAKAIGSASFSSMPTFNAARALPTLLAAHKRGREAIKSVRPDLPVGLSLSISDEQSSGTGSALQRKIDDVYRPWFDAVRPDDFVGVQTYGRAVVGPDGDLPPQKGVELTQTDMEFYPQALEQTVRWAARETGRPIIVTENGIATSDDTRRIAYIDQAIEGLRRAIADGVDVRGYIHWSLLDNFEWNRGYGPKFGLVAVDRSTFHRTPKPSAAHLGRLAQHQVL